MHISAPGTAFRERHKKDKMHISAPTTGLRGKSKTKTKAKHSASPVPSLGGSASNLVPGLPDSTELGGSELTLSEKLKVFKASGFEPEEFLTTKCRNMSEKVGYHNFVYYFIVYLIICNALR